jgi:hypothetical protein
MKRSRKLTLKLGIASLFVLFLANIGNCLDNRPRPLVRPLMSGGPPCPQFTYGLPVSNTPHSYGLQKCRTVNEAGCQNFICSGQGCIPRNPPFWLIAQIGYGHFALDFTMQPPAIESMPNTAFNITFPTALKLTLPGSNLPMGSIEARAESCAGLFLAAKLQGNVPKRVAIKTPEAPLGDMSDFQPRSTPNLVSPESWDGSKFQWWTIDTDLGYRVTPFWSVLLGLRRDDLSVTLVNPRDSSDQPFNYEVIVSTFVHVKRTVQLDFSSEFWVPYLGVEFTNRCCRASVIWGPFAWTKMQVPYRDFFSLNIIPQNSIYSLQFGFNYDYKCKSLKSANLVDYNFEYDLNTSSGFAVQLWTKGNWMQLSWRGELDEVFALNQEAANLPLPGVNSPHHSDVDTTTCSKWMVSGGIGAMLCF